MKKIKESDAHDDAFFHNENISGRSGAHLTIPFVWTVAQKVIKWLIEFLPWKTEQ